MNGNVLIVDDEPDIRELLEITLGRMSLQTETAPDLSSAKELLYSGKYDLCLTDMRLPDGDGIELVELIQNEFNQTPVAVITAHGSTETAIKALKTGAFDFVSKPVDLQKLRDLVSSALQLSSQNKSTNHSSGAHTTNSKSLNIKGSSTAIERLREQIRKLARSQAPIYISGESGSGKELAARAIHMNSVRQEAPFIAVNCGAIPEDLVESELFGHLKGSFTGADQDKQGLFQAANGGTLFLDEVADLPLHTQVKLLRVIQEKSIRPVGAQEEKAIDVRILSATHKNLAAEVEAGNLRQDLYFRINVIELAVPSLRERDGDIAELSSHILNKIAKDNGTEVCKLSAEAMTALSNYHFPGNVRELENILQRAATLCENKLVDLDNLEFMSSNQVAKPSTLDVNNEAELLESFNNANSASSTGEEFSLAKHLEEIEIKAIEQALVESRWNKTAAAKKLGMSFRSLRYRLKKLGLE